MTHSRIPTHTCECGNQLNGASSVEESDRLPIEGDITMCTYCGNIYCFNTDLTLREAMMSDLKTLEPKQREFILMAQRTLMNTAAIMNKPILPS